GWSHCAAAANGRQPSRRDAAARFAGDGDRYSERLGADPGLWRRRLYGLRPARRCLFAPEHDILHDLSVDFADLLPAGADLLSDHADLSVPIAADLLPDDPDLSVDADLSIDADLLPVDPDLLPDDAELSVPVDDDLLQRDDPRRERLWRRDPRGPRPQQLAG